jgi:hypothetical protein
MCCKALWYLTDADGALVQVTTSSNLLQSVSASSAQGYTLVNLYAPTLTGSPTVDNGTSEALYFTTDILGVSRPQGAAWDIGAYEYGATNAPSTTNVTIQYHLEGISGGGFSL